MTRPQDSGQPPFDSVGDPEAQGGPDRTHPGTRKRRGPRERPPSKSPAEGNDPSLTRGREITRKAP